MPRRLVYIAIILLAVLHHDFWLWNNATLLFGFLPIGLAYHTAYCVAASALVLAAKYAWPEGRLRAMIQLVVICYLAALLAIGWLATRLFQGTARDYFVASQSIGPFLFLMSIFSHDDRFRTRRLHRRIYRLGIGVLGMLASWSALVHTGVFFFVGIKLWSIGKRHGYFTQIQYFRERFESDALGLLLFPALVGLVIPYLLTALMGSGSVVVVLTAGALPDLFPATGGGIPAWLTNLVISAIVLIYVSLGGLRGAAWANTLQSIIFLLTAVAATVLIARALGGPQAATQAVLAAHPEKLILGDAVTPLDYLAYSLIPLSVGTFPTRLPALAHGPLSQDL
jgi:SSS family solute:Na+ symporter